jgi:uncharacterized membrane protein YjjP (DUF1212 family)
VGPRVAFLLDLGVTLLESGAETARAQETVLRAGQALGFDRTEAFFTPTGAWLHTEEEGRSEVALRRVERRQLALHRLIALNELSRALAAGRLGLEEARRRLADIRAAEPPWPRGADIAAGALASAGYAALLGATGLECAIALALGLATSLLRRGFRGHFADRFLAGAAGGLVAGAVGSLGRLGPGVHLRPAILIPAGILVLVPGLQATNAVRDVLHGDLMSAASLALEAVVLALGIAAGVAAGIGLAIWAAGFV